MFTAIILRDENDDDGAKISEVVKGRVPDWYRGRDYLSSIVEYHAEGTTREEAEEKGEKLVNEINQKIEDRRMKSY